MSIALAVAPPAGLRPTDRPAMEDALRSALRTGPGPCARSSGAGALVGMSFVVKDTIDVAGVATGAGNPRFLADSPPAVRHAGAVRAMLAAGATLVGKANTDELAFSLAGTNAHYGTPINAAAPDRLPGGSSSGSAAAVACGGADFALGTDTGGSIRVPASYCGIFGMRPTHGRVSLDGVLALAPSFDAIGALARSGAVLDAAMRVLLPGQPDPSRTETIVVADDLFALADDGVRAALLAAVGELADLIGAAVEHRDLGGDARRRREQFSAIQLVEAWAAHGAWIERAQPMFGPGVAGRFRDARAYWEAAMRPEDSGGAATGTEPARATLPPMHQARVQAARIEATEALDRALPPDGVLAIPAAPSVAPLLGAPADPTVRERTLTLTCLAPMGGLPAVSLPLGRAEGAPVGLSLIARAGDDATLLNLARAADELPGASGRIR